jgi:hypothetical protein
MKDEPRLTVLPSLGFARIRETLVFSSRSNGAAGLTQSDWDAWIRRLAIPDFTKLLVSAEHASPDAKKRAMVAEYWKKSGRPIPRTAMLSSSAFARSMLTAFVWLLGDAELKSFSPKEIADALRWLGSSATAEEASSLVFRIRSEKLSTGSDARTG